MMRKTGILTMVGAAALVLAGCKDKSDTQSGAGGTAVPDAAQAIENTAQKLTQKATDAAKVAGQAATDAGQAVVAKVQEAVKKTQDLISQNKLQEAQTKLQEAQDAVKALAAVKLTPEQEKLVADLKAKIEQAVQTLKATGSSAAKAVQDALPGRK